MRIPFVPKDVALHQDRVDFIRDHRGGGYLLMAGSVYWLSAFALFYVLDTAPLLNYWLFGGLAIPLYGFILYKRLRMQASPSQYSSLVGFASMVTVCCIPVLLIIMEVTPNMLLPSFCVINAAHLLLLCWVHLDYLYFILVMLGEAIGIAFMLSIPSDYVHFIGLVWGTISLIFGIIIHVSTKEPLKGYDYSILQRRRKQ
jgi:hypothetical protein